MIPMNKAQASIFKGYENRGAKSLLFFFWPSACKFEDVPRRSSLATSGFVGIASIRAVATSGFVGILSMEVFNSLSFPVESF